jgi:nitroreductase
MSRRADDFIRFLKGLRAIREYTPEPVSDDALDDILEVARWSGSASNRQPVELVVVRDPAVRQKMADNGARAAGSAAVAILTITPGDPERPELEAFDNGRMVERLMLAARAHGLGSNVMTLKGEGPEIIRRELGIPPGRKVWTVVSIGHIDREARRARPPNPNAGRRPLEAFVHRERW